jgi:hypothetical protein
VSTPDDRAAEAEVVGRAIRTPRSAAVAGIVFAVLLTVVLLLLRTAVPSDPADAGDWLTDATHRDAVQLALRLVPFCGIAFLWFVGVLRDRVGALEDRFFATVFLGSGLIFVAMVFAAAAMAAGLIGAAGDDPSRLVSSGAWETSRRTVHEVMVIYAMRMAAVFALSASTILVKTRLAPRWLSAYGYVSAAILMVFVGFFAWVELLFPLWVLVLSLYVLVTGSRRDRVEQATGTAGPRPLQPGTG